MQRLRLVGVEPLDPRALRAPRAPRGGAQPGGSTRAGRTRPFGAPRTSRPSARPSSSRALQGSIVRSIAIGCDSRGDGDPSRGVPQTRPQRPRFVGASRVAGVRRASLVRDVSPGPTVGSRGAPSTTPSTPRSRSRRERSEQRVGVPAGEGVRGNGGESGERAREAARSGRDRRDVVVDAASADGTAAVAAAGGGERAPGGGAAAAHRAGAGQGRRDVAGAGGDWRARWCATWTRTPRSSRHTS